MFGAPDRVTDRIMQWLLFPGPPVSAYLTYYLPRADVSDMQFFHKHPETWSVHVVLSGSGEYAVDGKVFPVSAGSVMYHGPNVEHSIYPLVNDHLAMLCIQHPALGWAEQEWVMSPEAGTVDHYRDVEAFVARFGNARAIPDLHKILHQSERWIEHTRPRRR